MAIIAEKRISEWTAERIGECTADRKPAYKFLEDKYHELGIKEDDIDGKTRVMEGLVRIPNFPVWKKPGLLALETQFLKDHGYKV